MVIMTAIASSFGSNGTVTGNSAGYRRWAGNGLELISTIALALFIPNTVVAWDGPGSASWVYRISRDPVIRKSPDRQKIPTLHRGLGSKPASLEMLDSAR